MSTALGVILVALLVWSVAAGIWLEPRLQDWYVARVGRRPGAAVLLVGALQLAWLAGWLLVGAVGSALADAGGPTRAGWVVLPACVAYGPWVMVSLPTLSPFASLPSTTDLRRRGAGKGAARAIAWTGAPFAFVGLGVVTAALLATFAT
jgi:hypothetical protein